MRMALVISAIIGIAVAGAGTATMAKPGDHYNNFDGSCDPGDTVNPPGSSFHCTEKLSANPSSGRVGAGAASKGGKALPGSKRVPQAPAKPVPVAKTPTPTVPAK